jgi:hypothetical protein
MLEVPVEDVEDVACSRRHGGHGSFAIFGSEGMSEGRVDYVAVLAQATPAYLLIPRFPSYHTTCSFALFSFTNLKPSLIPCLT